MTGDASARERIGVLHARIVSGTGGGPEKTILASPRHLEGTRYRALAAYLHAPGDPGFAEIERRAQAARCPLVGIAESWPIDPRSLARLAELCRAEGVRIWHGHDYKSNLYGLLLRRRLDLRLVTTVHGWVKHTARTPLYFAVDRACIRRYAEVVCVSQDLFESCLAFGVARERLSLVENAIDTDEFRRRGPPGDATARDGVPAGRLVVGAIGRLSEEKGFHLLIEAVGRLVREGLDLELWIAGEGDQQGRLDAARRALDEPDRVRLLGWRRDLGELYEALDVFALSSLREGLPNVVLEAMATEVPLVATRCGGLGAFLRDGEDALLVEPGSAASLADGLRRLIADARLRERLARTARERVVREKGFAERMRKIVAVYDRLGL